LYASPGRRRRPHAVAAGRSAALVEGEKKRLAPDSALRDALQAGQHLFPVLLAVLAALIGRVVVLGELNCRLPAVGSELDRHVVEVLGRLGKTRQRTVVSVAEPPLR